MGGGGAERVVSNLTMHLDNNKYKKFLIVYDKEKIVYPYDAKLISLENKRKSNALANIYSHIERIKAIKKTKEKYNFDIVISFLPQPNFQNIISRKNEKVIISVRNYISKRYHFFNKIKAKMFYKNSDLIVSVSKKIKEELENNYNALNDQVEVVYNPYDIEKIIKKSKDEIEEKYKEIFKKKTIITMGSLHYQKGQWHLIKAFSSLIEKGYDINLVILGKGELEKDLKSLSKKLGIEDNVFFLGFKENPFKYLTKSYAFVFPSIYEGFPNALLEAMACKLPVISTDCKSGPREIIAPNFSINEDINYNDHLEHGFLINSFKNNNIDDLNISSEEISLSNKIEILLKDKKLHKEYSEKAFIRAKQFEINKIIKIWERLIEKL